MDQTSLLLQLKYHGYGYYGWVMQKNLPTIEQELRRAWQEAFGQKVRCFPASRTDAQVHAHQQWVKVVARENIFEQVNAIEKINRYLPADIQVLQLQNIPHRFDVMSAFAWKEYCYLWTQRLPQNLPLAQQKIWQFEDELDGVALQQAAQLIEGRHNFSNFQRREKKTAMMEREILSSQVSLIRHWEGVELDQEIFCYRIRGKGFLRQMVRILMGALLNVGQKKCSLEELNFALKHNKIESNVGFVAPGYGLHLVKFSDLTQEQRIRPTSQT